VTTVAGGYVGDGGKATSAAFTYPVGIAQDKNGNYYVSDLQGHRIREINASNGKIVLQLHQAAGVSALTRKWLLCYGVTGQYFCAASERRTVGPDKTPTKTLQRRVSFSPSAEPKKR
jgi:NHL repeat